jgi:dephospho-CoA kinase
VKSSRKKPVLGIMGGVGSGKSTVAVEFARLGCKIIDADEIAHQVLEETDIIDQVVSLFGEGILTESGDIDRGKLAQLVFCEGEGLSKLNGIIHPVVLARVEELIDRYNGEGDVPAIVLDMPLLVEIGWEKRCDKLIFVDCREPIRAERAKKKGILTESELKNREKFQKQLDSKAALADNIINNNNGYIELARQVAKIFSFMVENE